VKYGFLAMVSLAIIALDQWSKNWVVQHFNLGETFVLISGLFHFTYIRNTGAAFGMLANLDPAIRTPFFYIVPTLALSVIAWIYVRLTDEDKLLKCSLAFVVGGAIGNFIDRIRYGYVVDFFDFHVRDNHFPAFNVADMAISFGVILMFIDLFLKMRTKET